MSALPAQSIAELVGFWRARLGEVEARRQDAGSARIAWLTYRDDAGQLLYTTVAAGGEGDWDTWVADGKELPEPASARVVYDPAAVLRSVVADRAILEAYKQAHAKNESRATAEDQWQAGLVFGLEQVVRERAAVFSGHPDFKPEWGP